MDLCKFIWDNAAKRATITVTPLVVGTTAAAMLNDIYSNVCRAQGTSMTITLVWPTPEVIGGVHEPWCNLSPTATKRVVGSSGVNRTGDLIDTGAQFACPWPARELGGLWTPQSSASAYAHGGGSHGRAWFPNMPLRRLDIDLVDVANRQGYIEVSKLFIGPTWSPAFNVAYDSAITPGGTSTGFRDGSGRLRSTRGTKWKRIAAPLSHMSEDDRAVIVDRAIVHGLEIPFIYSQYPNSGYPKRERDYQGYFALEDTPATRRANFAESATELPLASV